MNEKQFDVANASRLDNPERLLWLPPAEVIAALSVQPGDSIADVGAGTGYFSFPLAEAVGVQGKIFAIDAKTEMLQRLQKKLDEKPASNIALVHASAEATSLPDACCTLVFLANVWHEFDDRTAVLREARRILKPGGRIAILDWRPDVERIAGPPLEHRLSATDAESALQTEKFAAIAHTNIGRFSWLVQGTV
jgi:ubiquinone/menaquinone biosynthesis C-methylase UbiE